MNGEIRVVEDVPQAFAALVVEVAPRSIALVRRRHRALVLRAARRCRRGVGRRVGAAPRPQPGNQSLREDRTPPRIERRSRTGHIWHPGRDWPDGRLRRLPLPAAAAFPARWSVTRAARVPPLLCLRSGSCGRSAVTAGPGRERSRHQDWAGSRLAGRDDAMRGSSTRLRSAVVLCRQVRHARPPGGRVPGAEWTCCPCRRAVM